MAQSTIPRDRIDDALDQADRWRSEKHCPGMSIAVVDGTETVATAGFGYRQLNPKEPATGTTRYAVGSVTKPITALATLYLADEYGIDLDDPVAEYVPYFSDVPGEPITAEQLLTHTSGMPDDDLALLGEEVATWDEFREFIAGTTDRRLVDRERWLYYNSGYAVLARLIEAVTGTDFPAFVGDVVLDPLGMEASSFAYDVFDRRSADVMAAYSYDGEEFHEESLDDNEVLAGAGGLVSTVEDLATLVAGHTGDDPAIDKALVARTPAATRRELVDGTIFSYGYGWEQRPFGSDTLVCHSGNTGFSGGFVGFLIEQNVGISLGFNARPASDPAGLGQAILTTLLGTSPAMITLVSDTHGTSDHRLDGQTLTAVREAETVIHAGDFTTETVYDAFESEAADLVAVAGNNDDPALVERLPSTATVDCGDARLLVVHGHEHTETALSMLARQEEADVVVVGHSHRPELSELSGRLLVNPGSHADPRRYRPGHATVHVTATAVTVRLCHPAEGVVTEVSRPL